MSEAALGDALNERNKVELPVIAQLVGMGWEYIEGDTDVPAFTERENFRQVLLEGRLRAAVRRINVNAGGAPWLDDAQVDQAVTALERTHVAGGLVALNRAVMDVVILGTPVPSGDEQQGREIPVQFIDFERPERNDFLVVNQFRVDPTGPRPSIIPDVVLFVNGIPLVVVEAKSPTVTEPLEAAITQILRYSNQRGAAVEEGVERLFRFNAFIVATCYYQARAATVGASYQHYAPWKDTAPVPMADVAAALGTEKLHEQQTLVAGMLRPDHLLDILRNFTVYDDSDGKLVKKVARYQQFRAVQKAVVRLSQAPNTTPGQMEDGRGGVIWHTQGSGKSLTMVFLVKKMRSLPVLQRFKVIVVTDRHDLEVQLGEAARLSGDIVDRATGRADLITKLRAPGAGLLMAMLQKYRPEDEAADDGTIEAAFPLCNDSAEILLLIDEAHRGQTGALHAALIQALPRAAKIAFTGTPILLGAKTKTHEAFGPFIDVYTIRMSEDDGATLQILYEGRQSRFKVQSREDLDLALAEAYPDATGDELETIRERYVTTGSTLEAPQPIAVKAADILAHYIDTAMPGGFKAQLVANSRMAAARYQQALVAARDALVASLEGDAAALAAIPDDQVAEMDGDEGFRARAFRYLDLIKRLEFAALVSGKQNQDQVLDQWSDRTTNDLRIAVFKRPLVGTNPEKSSPLAILCVKSMLLTGFDAPVEEVIYIDRPMQGAELLQAIARVNRVSNGKTNGLVVDYVGLGDRLSDALNVYAAADVEGAVRSVSDQLPALEARHAKVLAVFTDNGVASLTDTDAVMNFLADPRIRGAFIGALKTFLAALDAVLPRPAALKFVPDAKRLAKIAAGARTIYRDDQLTILGAGFKVQDLIDRHLVAVGIDPRIAQISILDAEFDSEVRKLTSPRTRASQMEHAMRHHIDLNRAEDPARYRRLSERLEDILQRFEDRWDDLAQQLELFLKDVRSEETDADNTGLSAPERAVWRLLVENRAVNVTDESLVDASRALIALVRGEIGAVDFWRMPVAQETLRTAILKYFDDHDLVPYEQLERTSDEMMGVARAQHARLVA